MFSGSKQTFGAPASTGFGFGNNNQQQQPQQASPFGNSFARPAATTGFGQPQAQTSSLFGAQPQASVGLFGAASAAPTFGQTQAAPQTGFAGKDVHVTHISPYSSLSFPCRLPTPGQHLCLRSQCGHRQHDHVRPGWHHSLRGRQASRNHRLWWFLCDATTTGSHVHLWSTEYGQHRSHGILLWPTTSDA